MVLVILIRSLISTTSFRDARPWDRSSKQRASSLSRLLWFKQECIQRREYQRLEEELRSYAVTSEKLRNDNVTARLNSMIAKLNESPCLPDFCWWLEPESPHTARLYPSYDRGERLYLTEKWKPNAKRSQKKDTRYQQAERLIEELRKVSLSASQMAGEADALISSPGGQRLVNFLDEA